MKIEKNFWGVGGAPPLNPPLKTIPFILNPRKWKQRSPHILEFVTYEMQNFETVLEKTYHSGQSKKSIKFKPVS